MDSVVGKVWTAEQASDSNTVDQNSVSGQLFNLAMSETVNSKFKNAQAKAIMNCFESLYDVTKDLLLGNIRLINMLVEEKNWSIAE